MKRFAIFLACMLAFTLATTADNAIYNLKKIEKSRFGRNILDTIQLQLTTSDQIDRLVTDLENIASDVEADQAHDQQQNDLLQQECSDDIHRLEGEIQEADLKAIEAGASIAENTPILEQKKILLQEKKESLSVNQQLLNNLEEHYKQKSSEYQTERDEHSHAESVIRKAKEVLQGTFGSRSFLEIKKPSAQSLLEVSVHFSEHSKTHYKRKSWNSFFRILSSISQSAPIQADAGALQKLFEIIDELLEKIANSLEIEAKAFGQFETDYENNRDQFIMHITDLQKIIGELEAETHALQHKLDQDAHTKETQEKRSAEKNAELVNRRAFCLEQQHQYENRAAERAEQLDIIHQVLDIINSQLRVLKKYVSDRTE